MTVRRRHIALWLSDTTPLRRLGTLVTNDRRTPPRRELSLRVVATGLSRHGAELSLDVAGLFRPQLCAELECISSTQGERARFLAQAVKS